MIPDEQAPPRQAGERAPRLDAKHLRQLIEHAGPTFYVCDEDGRFLDGNQRTRLDSGYTWEELLQMNVADLLVEPSPEENRAIFRNLLPGGSYSLRCRYRRKNGEIRTAEVHINCQLIEGRKLFLGMVHDTTEQLEAERALRELNAELEQRVAERTQQWRQSTALLRAVMNQTPDLIFVKDREGRYLMVNDAIERTMGRSSADTIGKTDFELFEPAIAGALVENDRQVMDSGEAITIEENAHAIGVLRVYASTKAPYRDEQGRIVGLIGISHDITDIKRTEADLRRSEARWQFALEGSGDGVWDWNMESGQVFFSRQWKAMLGYAEDEVGSSFGEWSNRVHPDDLSGCWAAIEAHLAGDTPFFTFEYRLRAKDGGWRWILDRGKLIERSADGQPARMIGTHTDITALKANEEAVLELNRRLQLAIQVSGVGIWELPEGLDGPLLWDEQLHRLHGYEPGTFHGDYQDIIRKIHPDDRESVLQEWQAAFDNPTVSALSNEHRILLPNGNTRHLRVQAMIFRNSHGVPARLLAVTWDVTAAYQAADAMRRAKEGAEATERAKSEFLAMMSHEIRTPMNTVLGMTRLALQTELAPKQRNYLGKVNAAAQTLLNIINNVLDFSKIEVGRLELEEAEFTLESVLESVAAVTAMKAEEKGLEIAYAIDSDVPDRLLGDSLRLGQVLINLVNNAVKFTEHGEVVVTITAARRPWASRATLQFEVRDTGIGLETGQIANLFHAFTQADRDISRKYGGTGLGLAICKQLVELMGGRIWATGEPGKGSSFHFTIEARVPEDVGLHGTTPRPPSLAGRSVLITDDNASARAIFSHMLRNFGMRVDVADSGAAALKMLRQAAQLQHPYELVLMDWRMPDMDGLETAQHIRTDAQLQRIPAVLMVTAYGREEVLRRAEQLGLQGVLIKPVTESIVFETIVGVIGETAGTAVAELPPAEPTPPRQIAGLAGRRVLIVDDNALNREVASEFALAAGMRVDTAVDGAEALAKLERADYDAVLMDVHMPGMDGLSTAREIRRHHRWAALPLIALTARAQPEDRHDSAQAGMNAHLTKPLDEATLYETLQRLLPPLADEGIRGDFPAAGAGPDLASLLTAPTRLDLPAALEHLGGKRPLLLRLMRSFVEDFSDTQARLAEELREGRAEAIAARVHAARGAAAYLYAREFGAAAEQLEDAAWREDLEAIAQHLPPFNLALAAVLAELDELLVRLDSGRASPAIGEPAAVLPLLARIAPLIESGDYAAQPLLIELIARTAGTPLAPLVAAVHDSFDRLELEEAAQALHRLRDAAAQPHASEPTA